MRELTEEIAMIPTGEPELETLHIATKEIYSEALRACDISSSFDKRIKFDGNLLHRLTPEVASPSTIDLHKFKQIFVIAFGKAANPMLDSLLIRMKRRKGLRGIYCSNQLPDRKNWRFQYFEGGHPVPNEDSFAAARATLALLKKAGNDTLIFFLISGGGSAMLELPLDSRITLAETIAFHQALLGSGAPINDVNTVRKHFSAVKGGCLALAAPEATKVSLLLPDVPLGALDALSSGPTVPDRSTTAEVDEVLTRNNLKEKLPELVRKFFQVEQSTNKPVKEEAFHDSWFEVLLSSRDLEENARAIAEKAGYFVVVDNSCDDWDYAKAAHYLLDRFHTLRAAHPRICLISVGEVTVTLNENPGNGGRNQQFVLQCALELARHPGERLVVLSAGSDGIDGNTRAAGAIADVTTVARAHALGYDAEASLAAFDAFPLFAALNDLVVTGSSGHNLRDLRLLIADGAQIRQGLGLVFKYGKMYEV